MIELKDFLTYYLNPDKNDFNSILLTIKTANFDFLF